MNKLKLIGLLLLLLTNLYSQSHQLRDSVFIDKGIYEVMYSEKLEQPLWVKYKVTCLDGTVKRAGLNFYTESNYVTSDDSDYINNEWDKGHLAPAADFNCDKKSLFITFSYLNCSLQHKDLNRGLWRLLEIQERKWASKEPITVLIKLVFNNSLKLKSGATVPSGFYKKIYFENSHKVRVFYFKNITPPQGKTIWDYEIE